MTTAAEIVQMSAWLHVELPGTHVLTLAVLPKGEIWPNRCSDAILAVNQELEVSARSARAASHAWDCQHMQSHNGDTGCNCGYQYRHRHAVFPRFHYFPGEHRGIVKTPY
jgi:hypothetical protein